MSNWHTLPLTLVPTASNSYPLQGILIQGAAPLAWLQALSQLRLEEEQVICYAVPDRQPNQIWGCLVVTNTPIKATDIAPHLALQWVHQSLFIPEHCQLSPHLTAAGLSDILFNKNHLLHPSLGLVELFEPLDWSSLLLPPLQHNSISKAPEEGSIMPDTIKVFTVEAAPITESLDSLDAVVPQRKDLQNKPLSAAEVLRLKKLRAWKEHHLQQKDQPKAKGLWARLQDKVRAVPPWTEELEQELEALEQRNKHPMSRLVDLFKEDPEEALKYAIPLHNGQIGRGYGSSTEGGNWDWMPRWASTSLFQSSSGSGGYSSSGSFSVPNSEYYELQRQYQVAAQKLIKEGKFDKAAFIYLRLLRSPKLAAETLIKNGSYEQAASIYLKYLNDKPNAAFCYEKANRLQQALELYKELGNNKKVGDLYQQLGQAALAKTYYEKVLEKFLEGKKYHAAALFCADVLDDEERSFELAFAGWFHGTKPIECLQYCLDALVDSLAERAFLEDLYKNGFTENRLTEFLQILRNYYNQEEEEQLPWVRALAYQAITDNAPQAPHLLRQLLYFNPKDKHLSKDILRFRLSEKR
jgi:tetratricopeptide (TPR) repeat protein